MGIAIGARLKAFIRKVRQRKPTKQELFNLEIEHKLQMVVDGLNGFVELNFKNVYANIDGVKESIAGVVKSIDHERVLRKSQGKRANDKLKQEMATIDENFKAMAADMSKVNDVVNKKSSKIAALIERFEWCLENFAQIETLSLKANSEYEQHEIELRNIVDEGIERIKKDISHFKKNDNAVVRLSGLETRITMTELECKKLSGRLPVEGGIFAHQ
jgi:hypothetical protein